MPAPAAKGVAKVFSIACLRHKRPDFAAES
jgi:hypothetical protein